MPILNNLIEINLIFTQKVIAFYQLLCYNPFVAILTQLIVFEINYKEVQSWQNVQFVEKALISVTM